ncbi:DUF930 domain-containing protein [Oricola nitratireducens]|uniref:DUF930 domain-containing protein n=1 Tax=Oricola nitratireducens TaxID=2775868 RepID=UPI0018694B70|nr:DUF930 domain-containing protein [Oricola nitratireducens]
MTPGAAMPPVAHAATGRIGALGHRLRDPGFLASLALHLAFLLALLLAVPKPPPPVHKERSIQVQLLDPGQFEAMIRPQPSAIPAPALPAPAMALPESPPDVISFPADLPPPPHAGETIVAKRFLAMAALDDPRSADAKAALPQLAPDERVVQLCSIEALEQIAALGGDYNPDLLAAYSMGDIRIGRDAIDAAGAAFRSRGKWYRLAFKCSLTRKLDDIAAFEFRIGDQIPHVQWAAHNLVEGNDED